MASLFRSFSKLLLKRPLATQCATSAVLFASGDIIAQQAIERKSTKHDFSRTARLTFYGGDAWHLPCCIFGPPVSKWISFLSRLEFATPAKAVIYRTWLDQTLMAPFAVLGFFTSMPLLEGKGLSGIIENVWSDPDARLIVNFTLVPPQFRFVFIGVVSLVWNTYLSVINAQLSRDTEGAVGF